MAATFGDAFREALDDLAGRDPKRVYHCMSKTRFDREADALDALEVAENRSPDGSHLGMRAYRCRYGRHWHIGHPKRSPA